jgi:glycosyltransferase involved in cell wall biosynthesis
MPTHSGHHGIAFVGDYVPRACGIATFTHDLAESLARLTAGSQPVIVVSMNDRPEGYAYPDRVKFEVRQEYSIDYSRAADFLNFSHVDVVCLQHEYGIFGGEWGSNVLTLLRDLHRPLVVTCHTLIKDAQPGKKEVFEEIAARATRLVVMSELGVKMLREIYGVPAEKIALIPHGIHDVPFIDPSFYKDKFGVEGRNVLLTFGLLHREKGIEYMIEALPGIVERHPRTTYLILGATHPRIVEHEGESYRLSLQRRVRDLGMEDHVLFHPRFVELDELLEYLGAADICVSPYLNLEQITSGALSYAMASGKAVVSTPYWHAEELLAEGRGRLVPLRDSDALSREINALLDDEVSLATVRKKAYLHTRSMVWSNVANEYLRLFDEVRSHAPRTLPTASALRQTISATNLPTPRLDHLARLFDDTGPAHYARFTVPEWSHGYHLDDAAAALVATTKFHNLFGDRDAVRIAGICMALLQTLIGGREPAASLDYSRVPTGRAREASIGKALWALGYVVSRSQLPDSAAANDLFHELISAWNPESIAGSAYGILGSANYLIRFQGASDVRRLLAQCSDRLAETCGEDGWIDRWEAPDWPVAAQAVTLAARALERRDLSALADRLVADARRETGDGTTFLRRGRNPDEEQLPVTAATFIEALGAAYYAKRTPEILEAMRRAADWFLGANRKEAPLYDFVTGGCCDALTASGLNRNQGTEAVTFCLLAFLTLTRIAGMEAPAPKTE